MYTLDEAAMNAAVNTAKSQFTTNISTIPDRTPAAVLNLPGAAADIDNAKRTIEHAIDAVKVQTTHLTSILNNIIREGQQSAQELNAKRGDIEHMEKNVSETKTIFELRKEQSAALVKKYEGNYHSSWLGLWRPLKDETRTGLIVTSVVFGLIAIICLVFYLKDLKEYMVLPGIFKSKEAGTTLLGGFRSNFVRFGRDVRR